MEELKSLFGEGSLSYDEFEQKLGEAGETIKLANLKSGNYVDKAKFEKVEKSLNDYQTKYSALQENTKDYEQVKASYDDITNKYNDLLKKQDETEKMSLIKEANVNPKFAEFVYSKVSSQVTESKDFKTTLEGYLKENPEFFKEKKGTFVDLERGEQPTKSSNERMNDLIRGKK